MLELREAQLTVSRLPVGFLPGGLGSLADNSRLDRVRDDGVVRVGSRSLLLGSRVGDNVLGTHNQFPCGPAPEIRRNRLHEQDPTAWIFSARR